MKTIKDGGTSVEKAEHSKCKAVPTGCTWDQVCSVHCILWFRTLRSAVVENSKVCVVLAAVHSVCLYLQLGTSECFVLVAVDFSMFVVASVYFSMFCSCSCALSMFCTFSCACCPSA